MIFKKEKKRKENPNLACKRQKKKKNQIEELRLKNIKECQNKGILCKRNKETEAKKNWIRVLGWSMHAHT